MILVGRGEEVQKNVFQIPEQVMNYAKRFPQGHWTFRGPGSEKKSYGNTSHPPEGK